MVNDTTAGKTCRDCGAVKAPDDFNKHPKTRDGRQPHCRDCQRARNARHYHANKPLYQERAKRWKTENPERLNAAKRAWAAANPDGVSRTQRSAWLKFKYGITVEQYDALLKAQGGCCAICGNDERASDGKRFHVDHDHETGEIRGILCQKCNMILGLARDSCDTLGAAIDYLKKAQSRR